MINTEKINSIIRKVFTALGTIALLLPNIDFLQSLDLNGIAEALIQVVGGVAVVVAAVWGAINKDSNEVQAEKIAQATANKIKSKAA